jgi:hypothetical protein
MAVMRRDPSKETVFKKANCKEVPPNQFKWEPFTWTFLETTPYELAPINYNKSLDVSQVRLNKKIDPEFVHKYANSIRNGDIMPAFAVFKLDDDQLLGDGHHTYGGCIEADITSVTGVYLFAHSDPIYVAALFNSHTNGIGEDPAETTRKAALMYLQRVNNGEEVPSIKEVAHDFNLNAERLARAIAADQTKSELFAAGVEADLIRAEATFAHIARVLKVDTDCGTKLATLAAKYSLTAGDVAAVVDEFESAKLDDKKDVLDRAELRLKRANLGKGGRKSGKASQENKWKKAFLNSSASARKCHPNKTLKLQFSDHELEQARFILETAADNPQLLDLILAIQTRDEKVA